MKKTMLALSFASGFSVGISYRERAVCEASDGGFVDSAVKQGAAFLVPDPENSRPQAQGRGLLTGSWPVIYKEVFAPSSGSNAEALEFEDRVGEDTHLINRKIDLGRDAVPGEKYEWHADSKSLPSESGAIDWNWGGCGDGQVDSNEECDDGHYDISDACVRCKKARCGDGQLWLGQEECERGGGMSTPKCDELLPELAVYNPDARIGCTSKCELDFDTCSFCGDRILQADFGEICDGTVSCVQLAMDYDIYPDPAKQASCGEQCKAVAWKECPRCGDSVVDLGWGEECDDGNDDTGDGCDSCRLTSEDRTLAFSFPPYHRN